MAYNPDKIKNELNKLPLPEQIEQYHEIGKKIHEQIEAKKQEAEKQLQKLGWEV